MRGLGVNIGIVGLGVGGISSGGGGTIEVKMENTGSATTTNVYTASSRRVGFTIVASVTFTLTEFMINMSTSDTNERFEIYDSSWTKLTQTGTLATGSQADQTFTPEDEISIVSGQTYHFVFTGQNSTYKTRVYRTTTGDLAVEVINHYNTIPSAVVTGYGGGIYKPRYSLTGY